MKHSGIEYLSIQNQQTYDTKACPNHTHTHTCISHFVPKITLNRLWASCKYILYSCLTVPVSTDLFQLCIKTHKTCLYTAEQLMQNIMTFDSQLLNMFVNSFRHEKNSMKNSMHYATSISTLLNAALLSHDLIIPIK